METSKKEWDIFENGGVPEYRPRLITHCECVEHTMHSRTPCRALPDVHVHLSLGVARNAYKVLTGAGAL